MCPEIVKLKRARGGLLKYLTKQYAAFIAVKEERKASLRKAEADCSKELCGERADHSVTHCWEKKLGEVYTVLARRTGKLLLSFLKTTVQDN